MVSAYSRFCKKDLNFTLFPQFWTVKLKPSKRKFFSELCIPTNKSVVPAITAQCQFGVVGQKLATFLTNHCSLPICLPWAEIAPSFFRDICDPCFDFSWAIHSKRNESIFHIRAYSGKLSTSEDQRHSELEGQIPFKLIMSDWRDNEW